MHSHLVKPELKQRVEVGRGLIAWLRSFDLILQLRGSH